MEWLLFLTDDMNFCAAAITELKTPDSLSRWTMTCEQKIKKGVRIVKWYTDPHQLNSYAAQRWTRNKRLWMENSGSETHHGSVDASQDALSQEFQFQCFISPHDPFLVPNVMRYWVWWFKMLVYSILGQKTSPIKIKPRKLAISLDLRA